jgi:protoheme IX farnesyltransferase
LTGSSLSQKIKDYFVFTKMRLASLVVFSAAICYGIAAKEMDWMKLFWLMMGGFLVTGASNGFNQIIEKDLDALMTRTQSRPLPQGRMSVVEGFILATLLGVAGVFILYHFMNPLSGFLGLLALLLYSLVYTPLKRETPFAVFVGAIPGSIPPLLGYVAYTGHFSVQAAILFSIQFMWQFPHFWAIAWRLDADYTKAGFRLLPSPGGKDAASAFQALVYTVGLVPVSLLPAVFRMSGYLSAGFILICGLTFVYQAHQLYKSASATPMDEEKSNEAARKLMFGSFVYLPLVQLAILFDKL